MALTRGYRTSPTLALQVLASLPPLDRKLDQEKCRYDISRRATGKINGEVHLPAELELQSKTWKHLRPNKTISWNKSKEDEAGMIIYTDGFKINGRVGVFRIEGATLHKDLARLDDHCTIFQAEVLAILQALKWIKKNKFRDILTRPDNQAALKAVCDSFHSNIILQKTTALLHSLHLQKIRLEWVKASVGITGNEEADRETKFSATLDGHLNLCKPKNAMKLYLRHKLQEKWQEVWNSGPNGRFTHMLIPKVSTKRLWIV